MAAQGRRRLALNIGVAAAVGIAFVAVQRFMEPAEVVVVSGAAPAPDFRLPLIVKGQSRDAEVTLASYRGRPVVLNFWATWCGICAEEKPQLQRLGASLVGAPLLGIASWDEESKVTAAEGEDPSGYPVALDQDGGVAGKFGIDGLPVTVVIDAQGRILRSFTGALSELDVKLIERLVATATSH